MYVCVCVCVCVCTLYAGERACHSTFVNGTCDTHTVHVCEYATDCMALLTIIVQRDTQQPSLKKHYAMGKLFIVSRNDVIICNFCY